MKMIIMGTIQSNDIYLSRISKLIEFVQHYVSAVLHSIDFEI